LFWPQFLIPCRVIPLLSTGVGIRKAIIDAKGRHWYMGSHNGRLGVIE